MHIRAVTPPPFEPSRPAGVMILVAHVFDVPIAELAQSPVRSPKATAARQVAIYLAHTVLAMSFRALGGTFGRSKSTAAYAVRRVEEMRDDPKFDHTLRWLETILRAAMEMPK